MVRSPMTLNDVPQQTYRAGLLSTYGGIMVVVTGGLMIAMALFTFAPFFTVGQTERAVVTSFGEFSYVADPGLHWRTPFVNSVKYYDINVQQFTTKPLNTYTVDNQEVDATLTVQWLIPASDVKYVFENIPDPEQRLLSMVIDRFKIEGGKINVTEFANNRGALIRHVYDVVKVEAARLYHLNVVDVQLPNLDYQPLFREAQAKAAVVKTQIEQAQGLKLKAEIDAETAKVAAAGTANAVIEQARGAAQTMRLNADAEAYATKANAEQNANAILLRGQAEAKAQELMADALAKNAALVEYQKATRWNGALPTSIYAGAPIPFMQAGK